MSARGRRPKYKKITREVIAQLPDDLLASTLFDYIWCKVGKNYARTRQVLARLPRGYRVIYQLFVLTGEIDNGGFNQYFCNGLDREAEPQLEALGLIGATKHQRIFRQAFKIRDQEKNNAELQRRYAKRTIESFFSTYDLTKLVKYDDRWYALDQELNVLLVKFIRKQPELFITERDAPHRKEKARR